MKKRGLIAVILGLVLFGVGCARHENSESTPKTTTQTIKTIDYSQLSESEKSEMTFVFERVENDDTSVDVDLKVINRTGKNIEFDGSKFILKQSSDSKEIPDVTATKENKIVVKSNSTKVIKKLFVGVQQADFQETALFCYKNEQNKLAYSQGDELTSKSSNLTDATLQKSFSGTKQKKTNADAAQNDNAESQNNSQDKVENQNPPAPKPPITNGDQAIAMVKSQYGEALNGTEYTTMITGDNPDGSIKANDGRNVFWVRLFQKGATAGGDLDDWTVYVDGTVVHSAPEPVTSNDDTDDQVE